MLNGRRMQVVSLNRSDIAQTATVSLATLLSLSMLAWVLAYWTWQWVAPASNPRAQTATPPTRVAAANGLFGDMPRERAPATETTTLIGVIAATASSDGYALLRIAEQPMRAIREGEEIAPGIRLAKVEPDQVLLERDGAFETLALPGKRMPAESTAPTGNKK